jgi:hypothetical protein
MMLRVARQPTKRLSRIFPSRLRVFLLLSEVGEGTSVLSLAVEAIMEDGEVMRYGKDDERSHSSRVPTGLLDQGSDFFKSLKEVA